MVSMFTQVAQITSRYCSPSRSAGSVLFDLLNKKYANKARRNSNAPVSGIKRGEPIDLFRRNYVKNQGKAWLSMRALHFRVFLTQRIIMINYAKTAFWWSQSSGFVSWMEARSLDAGSTRHNMR